jgi:hypothetical protein
MALSFRGSRGYRGAFFTVRILRLRRNIGTDNKTAQAKRNRAGTRDVLELAGGQAAPARCHHIVDALRASLNQGSNSIR